MKDFKGTKGKWVSKHENIPFADTGDYEYCATIEVDGRCIAQLLAKDEGFREADCNLIAAAPEMLESLQKLVEMLRSPCVINKDGFFDELDKETEKAKHVINKALGKEQSHE